MHYVFQFGIVWDHLDKLIEGALATLWMSCLAMIFGLAIGIACAYLRKAGLLPVRWVVAAYVEFFRNTPLLVQLFVLYFSLPAVGVRSRCGGGSGARPVDQSRCLRHRDRACGNRGDPAGTNRGRKGAGLTRLQIFWLVILFPALKTVYPALASQFVMLMLGSSIVSAISASELTAATNSLQSTTFRAFEFYFVATGMYLAMATAVRLTLDAIYQLAFVRGRPA